MPNVVTPQPDFKVFFRRLLIPGELVVNPNTVLTPSQIAGSGHQPDQTKTPSQQVVDAFSSYQPTQFKNLVIAKGKQAYNDYESNLSAAMKNVAALTSQISNLKKGLGAITSTSSGMTLGTDQQSILTSDIAYYPTIVGAQGTYFAYPHSPTMPSPLAQNQSRFMQSLNNVNSIAADAGAGQADITDICQGLVTILNSLIYSQPVGPVQSGVNLPATVSPVIIDDLLLDLINQLTALDSEVSISADAQATAASYSQQLGLLSTKLQDTQSDLSILKKSSAIQPIYDPILLDCLIGPHSVNTSMNRKGQPGTGSVTFHLPLASNGQTPDLFFGLQVNEVFNMAQLERQASSGSTATRGSSIPQRTLSILTANMREATIQPFDMMQVWARRRYSVSANFPGDYYPIFTGFVTKTTVSYVGSTVAVKVDGEDVSKVIRLARIDVDPSLDSNINSLGLNISPFGNNLQAQAENHRTGGQMIYDTIKGSSGSSLGLSDASFIDCTVTAVTPSGNTLVTVTSNGTAPSAGATAPSNQPTAAPSSILVDAAIAQARGNGATPAQLVTRVVNLAWDFKNIQVNIFNDLVNNWPPYATQLKNAFRMWQTDEMTKWEVCSQIAETQEFELYADNLGVVNYHPPLYYLNPMAAQYYIENQDIYSEAHSTDEKSVVTVMELDTQPSFFANGSIPNPIMQGRAFVSAATAILQRYLVRYHKKSSPIFSDTTPPPAGAVAPGKSNNAGGTQYSAEQGRTAYCRALLNRRNAELRSATVTINGTPEMRLCNTVAFVGDLGGALQKVGFNPFTAPPTESDLPNGTFTSLQQMLVYYISTISHSYTQGREFTTTLGLTHGRHWTDALPSGSVGYGASGPQTDATYSSMRQFYGQGNDTLNNQNFVSVASAKLQFVASGDPNALSPATNSQFGFTTKPVKPSENRTFLTKLSAAVSTSHIRSAICNRQTKTKDPKKAPKTLNEEKTAAVNAVSKAFTDAKNAVVAEFQKIIDTLKNVVNKDKKLISAYLKKVSRFIANEEQQVLAILANPEVAAFKAYLGGKNYKFVARESFTSGQAMQKTGAAFLAPIQQLGIDTTPITSFKFPIAVYVYVAQSPISITHAKDVVATTAIMADIPIYLKNSIKGVPYIVPGLGNTVLTSAVDKNHVNITVPSLPAAPVMPSFASTIGQFATVNSSSSATTPAITSALAAPAQIGVQFEYAITAFNNPTSYSATGLPTGLSVDKDSGLISGIPTSGATAASKGSTTTTPASAGKVSVTIGASNKSGVGTATLVLTVQPSATTLSSQLQQEYYVLGVAIAGINPKC